MEGLLVFPYSRKYGLEGRDSSLFLCSIKLSYYTAMEGRDTL